MRRTPIRIYALLSMSSVFSPPLIPFDNAGSRFYTVDVKNRERRKEAGRVLLDLSKYLSTLVGIGTIFTKEAVQWISVIAGGLGAIALFIVGVQTIAPDKEE